MEPLDTVAEYLVASDDRESRGEDQRIMVAKISGSRELDLDILITHPRFADRSVAQTLEANVEAIADLISAHTTTLVFANTRKMTETLVQRLRPFLGELVAGHHGSMDKNIRLEVERKLKLGHLRAVVTSSSLEMGIDIGSVDSSSKSAPRRHRHRPPAHWPRGHHWWHPPCTFPAVLRGRLARTCRPPSGDSNGRHGPPVFPTKLP